MCLQVFFFFRLNFIHFSRMSLNMHTCFTTSNAIALFARALSLSRFVNTFTMCMMFNYCIHFHASQKWHFSLFLIAFFVVGVVEGKARNLKGRFPNFYCLSTMKYDGIFFFNKFNICYLRTKLSRLLIKVIELKCLIQGADIWVNIWRNAKKYDSNTEEKNVVYKILRYFYDFVAIFCYYCWWCYFSSWCSVVVTQFVLFILFQMYVITNFHQAHMFT